MADTSQTPHDPHVQLDTDLPPPYTTSDQPPTYEEDPSSTTLWTEDLAVYTSHPSTAPVASQDTYTSRTTNPSPTYPYALPSAPVPAYVSSHRSSTLYIHDIESISRREVRRTSPRRPKRGECCCLCVVTLLVIGGILVGVVYAGTLYMSGHEQRRNIYGD
jgi:hypothetical protein